MGSSHFADATASTSITLAEGIDMSKLIDELMREIVPEIPEDAATVNKLIAKGATRYHARKILQDKHENHGWEKVWRGREYWYWKLAD